MDDERARLLALRQQHQRRLQVLEQQAATYGLNVQPEKQIEIEDLRTTVAGIDAQLGAQVLVDVVPGFYICCVANTGHKAKVLVQVDRRQAGGEGIQEHTCMTKHT